MRNTFPVKPKLPSTSNLKSVPSQTVRNRKMRDFSSDESSDEDWQKVGLSREKRASSDKIPIHKDMRVIIHEIVLVSDFIPELVNHEVGIDLFR